ncbi:hypothetical protein F444_03667 [Phytophthora nicotianae P1976]|uniref:Uncharacterized protein n=1 Tax=Phytophthora nicotianae P1976 TaxID=1317066 RepID=A0A081ATA4_PHYNI|nr:hypothetical protein F444_03667 [Phytophthora nicotianae P1976]
MDGSLPSYEAAMREARAYLRRRDLSSEDEIPLYFAWQRLYAAANANLSTDFLCETRAERRARQEARLAPRRGIPPPLFTSFDRARRTSAQASAFLRAGTSSDAAIEMMARRYRREAEKLRSSRDKLLSSLDDAEKRAKRAKRQKSPLQEVEDLLGNVERSEVLSDSDDPLSAKTVKGKSARSSSSAARRMKKTMRQQEAAELDSDDQLDASKVLPKSKARMFTGGKLGAGMSADDFDDEIGIGVSPAKAAALRRSNIPKVNPATMPSFSTDANVAAFSARVADWRMPPDIGRASSAPELSPKGTARKSTASGNGKRLSGTNELRESTPVENDRADVMFETSSGSSGMVEDGVGLGASMNVDARVSPMGRHRTKREDVAEDKLKPKRGQQNASKETGVKVVGDPSRGLSDADPNSIDKQQTLSDIGGNAAQKSEFQEKLLQISHAVGDMQVKIQGKQIGVTFKGALDGEADEKDSKSTGKVPESSFKSDETKQPFADQKVSDTSGSTYDERAEERDNDDNITQVKAQDKDVNVSHKPSNVRFAEVALNADNETHNVEGSLANEPARQSKPSQQNLAGGSVEVPPAKYQGRPRQIPTSQPHESVSKRSAPTVEATTTENNDKSKDTTETKSLGERFRSGKPQQSTDGERGNLRHEEDNSDEGEDRTDADSTGERVKAQDAGSRSKTDDDTLREQEYRFSSPREELGELKPSTLESASDYQGIHAVDTSNSLRRPPHIQSKNADRSRNLQQKQTSDEGQSDGEDFERDLRTTASKRAAFQESAELKYKDTELRDNRDSNYEGRHSDDSAHNAKESFQEAGHPRSGKGGFDDVENKHESTKRQDDRDSYSDKGRCREQGRKQGNSGHEAEESFQVGGHSRSGKDDFDEDDRSTKTNVQPSRTSKNERLEGNRQEQLHRDLGRAHEDNAPNTKADILEGVHSRSDEKNLPKTSDRAEIHDSTSEIKDSMGGHYRPHSKGSNREQMGQQQEEAQGVRDTRSDGLRSTRRRPHDAAAHDERNNRGIEGLNKPKGSKSVEQTSRPKRDNQETSLRSSRKTTDTSGAAHELKSSSTGRDVNASPAQKDSEFDSQSFSDASEDLIDNSGNDSEMDSDDAFSIPIENDTQRSSKKHKEQLRTRRHKSPDYEQTSQRALASRKDKPRTSRPSRNEREEAPSDESFSDEDLSDGPDSPHRRFQDPRHHPSERVLDDRQEARSRNDSKRISSQSKSSRHAVSHDKRRYYATDSSDNSDVTDQSDSDSQDEQSSDETHHPSSAHRSRSRQSTKTHRQTSRTSTLEPTRRSHYLPPSMNLIPKRSKPGVRMKRDDKSKSKTWSSKAAYKLPEGIVWPPGMEKECIARLGLDGHHPIAPPGLEHLVTEEQWGDYWTWLHWYSSWQMWYLKNGKKPKRKSDKEKRGRRHADIDETLDYEAKYHDKHGPKNANWWVDVGSSKRRHRHDRYR